MKQEMPFWTSVFSAKKYLQHILSELGSKQILLYLSDFDITLKYMVIFDRMLYIWLWLSAYKKQL